LPEHHDYGPARSTVIATGIHAKRITSRPRPAPLPHDMGIIISVVAITSKKVNKKRQKRKEEKIAQIYAQQGLEVVPQEVTSEPSELSSHAQPQPQSQLQPQELSAEPPSYDSGVPLQEPPQLQARELGTGQVHSLQELPASEPAAGPEKNEPFEMASDEDYANFLDKANEDPNAGSSAGAKAASGKVELKAVDGGVEVPKGLRTATEDAFFMSDADEPFVPVSLKYTAKSLPNEDEFAKLIQHPDPSSAEVTIQTISDWDPHGQYKSVVDATRAASTGSDVMVYRVGLGGVRVEYWLVGHEGKGKNGRLVGVKALAVES